MEKIKILDTTLRDGEQAPGFSMNGDEKLKFALQLEKLGVDTIEAGFAAASPDDFAAVRRVGETLRHCEVCSLSRATESDISAATQALDRAKFPRIHIFLATSDIHLQHKLKKTRPQIKKMAGDAVRFAKKYFDRINFSPEDAGRSDPKFLVEVIDEVIAAGADTINIADTVGYTLPDEYGNLMKFLIQNVKNAEKVRFSAHCHDDLGLAVANSISGIRNGARQIEGTINGIGERAGNTSIEEVVMILQTRKNLLGFETGVDSKAIAATSALLSEITGQNVPPNKAIVGANAFAHEAGIHQHGLLAHPETYEIMTPASIGREKTELVLGKHSGRAALFFRLAEMGFSNFSDDEKTQIFQNFKNLADQKKTISDADLRNLAGGK